MPWFQVDDKFWSHPNSGRIADRAAAGQPAIDAPVDTVEFVNEVTGEIHDHPPQQESGDGDAVDGDVVEQEVLDA